MAARLRATSAGKQSLEGLESVHARHADVQQRDVRQQVRVLLQRRKAIVSLGDDLKVGFDFQKGFETHADERMVIHEQ